MSRFAFACLLMVLLPTSAPAQAKRVETVAIKSGPLKLHALLFLPPGRGPFPAALINHGSSSSDESRRNRMSQAMSVSAVFVRHGYAVLWLFRRGTALSSGQGEPAGDVMARALARGGSPARNRAQLQALDSELGDVEAGLAYLRSQTVVDKQRIVVVGHSFGGTLSLLLAQKEPALCAVVDFAGGAGSWTLSPPLRERMLTAVRSSRVPTFVIHAANDYSLSPAQAFAAEHDRTGRPEQVKVYPAVGSDTEAGHAFIYNSIPVWEHDVFLFLDRHTRR